MYIDSLTPTVGRAEAALLATREVAADAVSSASLSSADSVSSAALDSAALPLAKDRPARAKAEGAASVATALQRDEEGIETVYGMVLIAPNDSAG